MAKKIRDTIHGYIYLTKIEEAVSQHPLVLRMHYIHQTSFTYLTYPNAHSTRYPHSLGVMHVAGEIFHSAIVNSPTPRVSQLCDIVSGYLQLKSKDTLEKIVNEFAVQGADGEKEQLYETLRQGTRQRANPNTSSDGLIADSEKFVSLAILFQAVRLAALLHDIGHPPFSHIVEYALLQSRGGKKGVKTESYRGHEPIGSELMRVIETDGTLAKRSGFRTMPIFAETCLRLCREILEAGDGSNFYGIKRSLLSGPIDADRLDYVRRDAYSAGMVPSYDIRRLVDAAFFRFNDDGLIEIGYRPNCLSSFENFFFARYDLYRYMIYHHDVIRRNLAVQRLVTTILDNKLELPKEIIDLGERFVSFALGNNSGGYANYDRFTDSYFLNMMWEIDDLIPQHEGVIVSAIDNLKFYLNLVLRRRNDTLRTLLKRPDAYSEFVHSVLKSAEMKPPEGTKAVPYFNGLLRKRLDSLIKEHDIDENVAKFELAHEIENHLNEASRKAGSSAKFFCYYLGTFTAGPGRRVWFSEPGGGGKVTAEDVSPTIAMLEEAWNYSPQLIVFFHKPMTAAASDDDRTSDIMRPPATTGFKNYLLSIC